MKAFEREELGDGAFLRLEQLEERRSDENVLSPTVSIAYSSINSAYHDLEREHL